jgi:oligosaccharide repeat unit polymerase
MARREDASLNVRRGTDEQNLQLRRARRGVAATQNRNQLIVSALIVFGCSAFLAIDGTSPWFPIFLVVAIGAVVAAYFPGRRKLGMEFFGPFQLILPVFIGYNFLSVLLGRTSTENRQLLFVAGSAIAFAFGVSMVRRNFRRSPNVVLDKDTFLLLTPSVSILILGGLLGVGAVLVGIQVIKNGFPLFSNQVLAEREQFYPNGYYSTTATVAITVAVICSGVAAKGAKRWKRAILLAIMLVGLGLLAVPGNRAAVLEPMIVLALYWLWDSRILRRRILIIGAIGLLLFSAAGYLRARSYDGPTYDADLAAQGYGGVLRFVGPGLGYVAGTSQTFDRTMHYFPTPIPYTGGSEFFGPLLHKEATGLFLKQTFGLNFVGAGLALGAMNALYLDWGPFGIVVGFFVFGVVSGYLYLRARIYGGIWVVIYCIWLLRMLENNYGAPFANLSYLLVPIGVIIVLRKRRNLIADESYDVAVGMY